MPISYVSRPAPLAAAVLQGQPPAEVVDELPPGVPVLAAALLPAQRSRTLVYYPIPPELESLPEGVLAIMGPRLMPRQLAWAWPRSMAELIEDVVPPPPEFQQTIPPVRHGVRPSNVR